MSCSGPARPGTPSPRTWPGWVWRSGRCPGTDWRAADVTGPQAAADAAKGASAVCQCVNAPYTQRRERFPPLQRGVLITAERTGLLLVVLESLDGYGPTGVKPMTEDLPLAMTVKGRARAAMTGELLAAAGAGRVRPAIGRASGFFGPGVARGSVASLAAR